MAPLRPSPHPLAIKTYVNQGAGMGVFQDGQLEHVLLGVDGGRGERDPSLLGGGVMVLISGFN